MEDNSHAGQGAVLLDIGGDVGALVVIAPASLAGAEIEARPVGAHTHPAAHPAAHGHGHPVHVAVLARPLPDGTLVHSAVFGALSAGSYELSLLPAGPVRLVAEIRGGAVTESAWT